MAGAKKKYDFEIFDVRKLKPYRKVKKKKRIKEDVYSVQRVPPYGHYVIVKKNMTGPLPKKLKGSWLDYEGAKRALDAFEM